MDSLATVSVILPVHNRADVLGQAIESVLQQSYSELELIVIDDGSTDPSAEVAASFRDPRIKLIRHDVRRGVCAARNSGLKAASNNLVAFQDSDDVWRPTKLAVQVAALASTSSAAVVGCQWKLLHSPERTTDPVRRVATRQDVLSGMVQGLGTPMLLVDRNRCQPAEFDVRLPALVERDYVLSLLGSSRSVIVVPDVLVEVRRGRSDHVARPESALRALSIYLEKYKDELDELPSTRRNYLYQAFREACRAGDRGARRRLLSEVKPADRARLRVLGIFWDGAGERGLALFAKAGLSQSFNVND